MGKRRFETPRQRLLCFGFTSEDESEWFDKVKKIWQGNTRQWSDLKWLRRRRHWNKRLNRGQLHQYEDSSSEPLPTPQPYYIWSAVHFIRCRGGAMFLPCQQKTLTFAFEKNNTLTASNSDSNNPHWQWIIVFLLSISMFGELLSQQLPVQPNHEWDTEKTECVLYSSKPNDIISGEMKYTKKYHFQALLISFFAPTPDPFPACWFTYKADQVALVWSVEFPFARFYGVHPQNPCVQA